MKFNIIYADPPYPYDNPKSNLPRLGGKTYPVMSLPEIESLPINKIAAEDCTLFLWVMMPKLEEGLKIIKAWGFKYTTCAFVWVKLNPKGVGIYSGLGHWTNGNAELCLFAKRGRPRRLAKNIKQITIAPRREHSRKPNEVREKIIQLVGNLPRIELFARGHTDGWVCVGNSITGNDIRDDLTLLSSL